MIFLAIILAVFLLGLAFAFLVQDRRPGRGDGHRAARPLPPRRPFGPQHLIPFDRAPAADRRPLLRDRGRRREEDHRRLDDAIDLREQVLNFPSQPVITKDNVTIDIDAVLYYRVADPQKATYAVQNLPYALETLTRTTLRNIVGEMELDDTLASRDVINKRMREVIEEAAIGWGVDVTRVELQAIEPPRDIQQSMELQMRAERERRAAVTNAEAGSARRSSRPRACANRRCAGRKARRTQRSCARRDWRGATRDGGGRGRGDRADRGGASRRSGRDVPARDQVPRGAAAHEGKGTTIFLPAEASGVMGALGDARAARAQRQGDLRLPVAETSVAPASEATTRASRLPARSPACRLRRGESERLSSVDDAFDGPVVAESEAWPHRSLASGPSASLAGMRARDVSSTSYKRLVVKPASASIPKAELGRDLGRGARKTCGVCGLQQELGIDDDGDIVFVS